MRNYYKRTAELSAEQLVDQIDSLSNEVRSKFKADDDETRQLEQFSNHAKKLSELAIKSDFPGVPANTYRSTLRLMVHILMVAAGKMSSSKDRQDFFTVVTYGNKWMEEINAIEKISGIDCEYSFEEARRIFQMFFDDGMNCFHAFFNKKLVGVNLSSPFQTMFRLSLRFGTRTIHPTTEPITDSLKAWFSFRRAVKTTSRIITQEFTARVIKELSDQMSNFGPYMYFKTASFLRSPVKFVKSLKVQKFKEDIISRYEIHIDADTGSVELRTRESVVTNKIKYYTIKSQGTEYENQVVFFVHGGAFIGPTAKPLNYVVLDQLALFLPGVTIVNIDIFSSVDGRFPKQLQQVLDLYVYLFSGDKKDSPISHPKDIVLLGESSGGCLIASLLITLNDLRKSLKNDFNIQMPRSIVPLYGRFFVRLHVDPSLLLMQWMDVIFLNVYTMSVLGGIYFPFRKRDPNGNWYLMSHEEKVPDDWMWRPDEYQIVDHPYVSPATYSDWASLSDVELHAVALHMDGILHDSVYLTRKWKGKVSLTMFDGVPHAAPYFSLCPGIDAAKRVNKGTFKIVKQAFGGTLTNNN